MYFVKVHATNVINFEKNRMLLLTRKELKLHQDATVQYICGKRFLQKFAKIKTIVKLETIAIILVNIEAQGIYIQSKI